MSTAAVAASQRYSRSRRCPICDGAESDPRGQSRRCIGFLSEDGEWARCSREEHAGTLSLEDASSSYVHRLIGSCNCGERHGGEIAPSPTMEARSRIVAAYDYRDEAGELLSQAVRFEPKDFRQRRPSGSGWAWNLAGVRRVLYRLPELLAADPSVPVYIVEGEKDCDALRALGLVATTNAGGAGKWSDDGEPLRGRRVVILPDNDQPGEKHAEAVARSLNGVAATVRVIKLPGLPPKGDACDWLAAGGNAAGLLALAEAPVATSSRVTLVCMADVAAEPVNWLWPGRAVAGAVNVLDGQTKLGKSSMMIDLVARVTTGREWPVSVGRREPRDVVLVGHEESPKHTIRPRLDAAGADVKRVHLLQEIRGRMPELPTDLEEIEDVVRLKNAAVLIFDPISAYVGGIDLHRDNEVRNALMPLATMAERTGVTIFLIRHVRKSSGGDAINRGLGSIGISAVARNVMMLLKDPDDDDARILTWPGMNVGPMPASLRWRFEGGSHDTIPTVAWDSTPVNMTAQDILDKQEEREHPALSGAEDFVREALAAGPMASDDLEKRGKVEGHTVRTIKRARRSLGVERFKKGIQWFAHMPGDPRVPASRIKNHGTVGTVGTLHEQGSQGSQGSQLNHARDTGTLGSEDVV